VTLPEVSGTRKAADDVVDGRVGVVREEDPVVDAESIAMGAELVADVVDRPEQQEWAVEDLLGALEACGGSSFLGRAARIIGDDEALYERLELGVGADPAYDVAQPIARVAPSPSTTPPTPASVLAAT